jgi:anti-sigma B factor antagonist
VSSRTKPFQVSEENGGLRFTAAEALVARNIPDQRAQLQEDLSAATGPVVLDLAQVDVVDSLGITLVVRLYKSCEQKGLAFSVAGASAEILRLFRFFSLSDLFPIKER